MKAQDFTYVFLDIDGVLNSRKSQQANVARAKTHKTYPITVVEGIILEKDFSFECVNHLKNLLSSIPQVRVVISSDWRKSKNLGQFKNIFQALRIDSDKIYDLAPICPDENRDFEIQDYLKKNKINHYVILDDFDCIDPDLKNHWCKIDDKVGFSLADISKAMKLCG